MALNVIHDFEPLNPEELEEIKVRASQQRPLFRYPRV
jgi:hypothetical protein